MRIARDRGSQPISVGCRVPKTRKLEPVGAGDEGVLVMVGALDDAVARTDLVHLAVLPGEPGAGEDVVDLLRGAVRVRRRRELSRRDAHAVDADLPRPGRAAEHLPGRIHLALGRVALLDSSQ